MAFDTTTTGSSAACPEISSPETSANYNISLEFGGLTGLPETVQMIVVSEIERTLILDESSNWNLSN